MRLTSFLYKSLLRAETDIFSPSAGQRVADKAPLNAEFSFAHHALFSRFVSSYTKIYVG